MMSATSFNIGIIVAKEDQRAVPKQGAEMSADDPECLIDGRSSSLRHMAVQ